MNADGSVIFVDTNVFFYAQDDRFPEKQAAARRWLRDLARHRRGVINLQVANEFVDVVRRKLKHLDPPAVFGMADAMLVWGNAPVTPTVHAHARSLHLALGYSWWDCLLLASALELRCSHFLSEDLQDGQRIESAGRALTIVDPFAHSPDSILSL